jgi:DNA modification methylase
MKIIEFEIKKLIKAEYNPRKLSTEQYESIKSSLLRFGMVDPVIVNSNPERENIIIGGHQRVKVWSDLGHKTIPCYFIDLTLDKEKELNVRLNKNTGEFDIDLLNSFFEKDELLDWGFQDFELELPAIKNLEPEETTGDDDVLVLVPDRTILGDIYQLGQHRLMCGDSADFGSVEKLMDGKLCDMVLTDPPYGVAYVGKTKDALTIENDECDEDKLTENVSNWFGNAYTVSRDGAYWIATVPPGPLHLIFASEFKKLGVLRQIMVWVKNSLVMGHSEYHYRHEPILFGWKPGGDRLKNTDRTKDTVWEFDRPQRSDLHPTMKPVEMWCYAINNHTESGDLLYEPFSGSGTTHIACEKTNRICYGMELSPKYCDVIVNRYVNFCKENNRKWSVILNGKDVSNEYG